LFPGLRLMDLWHIHLFTRQKQIIFFFRPHMKVRTMKLHFDNKI
jgi:hypothetical protein